MVLSCWLCFQPGRICLGSECPRPAGLELEHSRYPNRDLVWLVLCGLQPDGALGCPTRVEHVDDHLVYFWLCSGLFTVFLTFFRGAFLPGSATRPTDLFMAGEAWLGWFILFLLAAGPTVLGFGLYNASISYLPSSVANIILTLEPVFTTILAYFFSERS
jgi:hypothetical protein